MLSWQPVYVRYHRVPTFLTWWEESIYIPQPDHLYMRSLTMLTGHEEKPEKGLLLRELVIMACISLEGYLGRKGGCVIQRSGKYEATKSTPFSWQEHTDNQATFAAAVLIEGIVKLVNHPKDSIMKRSYCVYARNSRQTIRFSALRAARRRVMEGMRDSGSIIVCCWDNIQ